jgi:sec-independent protein translocase protein TatA
MPFQLGIPEVILVLVIALVFLGPKRLPEAGHAIGKGMREFRQGLDGLNHHEQAHDPVAETPPALPPYTPPPAYVPPPGERAAAYTPPAAPAAPDGDAGVRHSESQ